MFFKYRIKVFTDKDGDTGVVSQMGLLGIYVTISTPWWAISGRPVAEAIRLCQRDLQIKLTTPPKQKTRYIPFTPSTEVK